MRFRVNAAGTDLLGGGGLLIPVQPLTPLDLNELFLLEVFEATPDATPAPGTISGSAPPFSEMTVRWRIVLKDRATRFEDFEFRVIAPPQFIVFDIEAEGSHDFTLFRPTTLRVQGRRSGGPWRPLGTSITVELTERDCFAVEYVRAFVDFFVFQAMEDFLRDTPELRQRTRLVPVDADNPQGPQRRVQIESTSDWTTTRLRYQFPLEMVIPNYPNGDLDLRMDVRFSVHHDDDGSELDIRLDFKVNADFSPVEDVLLFGGPVAVAKAVEALLPLVLNCRKAEIEQAFADVISGSPGFITAMSTSRLLDVRIQTGVVDFIGAVFCGGGDDPVAPGDELAPV